MPGFNGSGPLGDGPMTGGGFGYCGSGRRQASQPRARGLYGRFGRARGSGGFGRALGRPYGWARYSQRPQDSRWWPGELDANTELAKLQKETENLQVYLKDLEARIAEIGQKSNRRP